MTLPKEKFHHYKENIYILEPDDCTIEELLDKPIYRYINFEMLYNLLNDKLLVWRKGGFDDLHEQGKNQNPFSHQLKCVGENIESEITPEDTIRFNNIFSMRSHTSHWLTTCFSKDADDDYFFWKCYTSNWLGARYKTTLGKILDNLVLDKRYNLFIGSIQYGSEYNGNNLTQYVFRKTKSYEHEHELRIYFLPKVSKSVQINDDFVAFHINSNIMIENILFSPFSNHNQRIVLSQLFKLIFPSYYKRTTFSKIITKEK